MVKANELQFRPPTERELTIYRANKAHCNNCGARIRTGEGAFVIAKVSLANSRALVVTMCSETCRVAYVNDPKADASIAKAVQQIANR